jgi:hypothetical protein
MTRAKVRRVLAVMNSVREAMFSASSERERARLADKYARLSQAIAPFVEGKEPYTKESAA